MSQEPDMPDNDPAPRRSQTSGLLVVAVVVLLLVVGLLYLNQQFPAALDSEDNQISFVYLLLLLGFLVFSSLGIRRLSRSRLARSLRYAGIWGGILLVILVGYSFRNDIDAISQRVIGDLVPGYAGATANNEMSVTRGRDGHFYINASASGVPLRFLVDTGASSVVLTPTDAERLGFDLSRVNFDRFYQTANGTVRGASVTLAELGIGGLTFRNVPVSINEAHMSSSLLGMSFLGQFESYEVRGDRLTLRW